MKIEIKHGGIRGLKGAVVVRQVTAQRYGDNVLLRVETDDKRLEALMQTEDFGGEISYLFTFFRYGELPGSDQVTEVTFRADSEWERHLFNNSRIFQYVRTYGTTAFVIPREPLDHEKMEELACYLQPEGEQTCGTT